MLASPTAPSLNKLLIIFQTHLYSDGVSCSDMVNTPTVLEWRESSACLNVFPTHRLREREGGGQQNLDLSPSLP